MAQILVVDDDDIVVDFVTEALEREGHVVDQALDGASATAKFDLRRPDLVLLDCSLPIKSGTAVLQEWRSAQASSTVPVVMMTARRSAWSVKIAMDMGASGYLKKPFSSEELLNAARDALTAAQ